MGPSNRQTSPRQDSLNAICPYFTMFPLSVPARQLKGAARTEWVLDPFCGRGTTNFAARVLGLPSVGVDSNPVAAAIAEAKMVPATPDRIVRCCEEILRDGTTNPPEGDFWDLCYHPRTLADITRLRTALIEDCASPERKALRAIVLGSLHGPKNKGSPSYLSNQMPRTFAAKPNYAVRFWSRSGMQAENIDVLNLVTRKAHYYFEAAPVSVPYKIVCGDSRILDFAAVGPRFTRIVTSPPYYGMRTYVPDQWLRFWFIGGPPTVTYSHPEQMSHASAAEFVEQLAAVWTNVARACVPGARFVIRFGGIHDRQADPKTLLKESLCRAKCMFRLLTVVSAGLSSRGKRQADQFKRTLQKPIEELDFHVRLEGPHE